MTSLDRVQIAESGAINVVGRRAQLRLSLKPGDYDLVLDSPAFMVLRRRNQDAAVRVLFCGEVCGPSSVVEALNIALMLQFRGEIWVQEQTGEEEYLTRVLGVEKGVLCNTRSSHPGDRLGEVLERSGFATKGEIRAALAKVGPEMRLGEALIANGALDSDNLYTALQRQAQQVMFNCLTAQRGCFAFLVHEAPSIPAPHTVHLPLQALLLEGVQRLDEMSIFRVAIPSDDLVVFPSHDRAPAGLSPELQMILAVCDGNTTVNEIVRLTGASHFHVIKSVYSLMQSGQVTVAAAVDQVDALLRELLVDFNVLLGKISDTIMRHGKRTSPKALRLALRRWWARSEYRAWLLPAGGEGMLLEVDALSQAILKSGISNPVARAQRMVSDVAAFALFLATTLLPRKHEERLSREVAGGLRRLRERLSVNHSDYRTLAPPSY